MKISLFIEKGTKEECPYDCPFKKPSELRGHSRCSIFDEIIYESHKRSRHGEDEACMQCQNLFEKVEGESK